MTDQELRALRNTFGAFMTGVTVVTTKDRDDTPRGFTANSFSSVSLDPPLVSVCIGKFADSLGVFQRSSGFAVNILGEQQVEVSSLFATKRADKFDAVPWRDGPNGHPILEGVCAWFDCDVEQFVEAGDHVMVIGRVRAFDHNERNGLGFVRGGYFTLELAQQAVSAVGLSSNVLVGAVVDCNGSLLLKKNSTTGRYRPIASGLDQQPGSIARLKALLEGLDIGASIASIYAVFESESRDKQFIYYRAIAERQTTGTQIGDARFFHPGEIPWDQIEDDAITTMLRRYIDESKDQRYGVYFGSEKAGTVHAIA